ncbi:MAG TPA: carbon starvation protein A [Planctomycetaceae bacterium]|nr:carbon starvation protein A [Planctomycetaceae bacterium]
MSTLLIAVCSFFGFIVAYHTYGRFLSRKLFHVVADEPVPSVEQRDDIDFIPTNRFVLFGHHFTAIAGTGPIVGPAIAVLWGWLPALLWVVFGCILVGAVHDFTALVLSVRNKGQTLGDIAGRILSPAARSLFLILLTFLLALVIAVFCNIMATMFNIYPESVVPVWVSIPIAMALGMMVYRLNMKLFWPSLVSLTLLYLAVWLATYYLPEWKISGVEGIPLLNPTMIWVGILLFYCFFASVLPVWLLLQPRDYVNSHQLFVGMGLVVVGLFYAAFMGKADVATAAPAVRGAIELQEAGTPPIFPFLFITVACGAASGFHALVSSGTSSKQIASMKDTRFIGFGGMLTEGALAVVVIIACTAGVGMGTIVGFDKDGPAARAYAHASPDAVIDGDIDAFTLHSDGMLTGREAWTARYGGKWDDMKLGEQVAVFVEGGSNFIEGIGVPAKFAHCLMAVMIVCFAATTLDCATRLLRYVLQELGHSLRVTALDNRYSATVVAVLMAGAIATCRGIKSDGTWGEYGTGGNILWPLFGAGNQVIVGLTLLIGTVYLFRRKAPVIYLLLPAIAMLIIPLWGMIYLIVNPDPKIGWFAQGQYMLGFMGIVICLLACRLVVESCRAVKKLKEESAQEEKSDEHAENR